MANTLSVSTPQNLESFELYLTAVADNKSFVIWDGVV